GSPNKTEEGRWPLGSGGLIDVFALFRRNFPAPIYYAKDFPVGYRVMTYMTAPMHVMRCLSQLRKLPTFILLPTMFRLCRQVHQVRTRSAIPLKIATMRTINNQPATQSVANSGNGGRWCN